MGPGTLADFTYGIFLNVSLLYLYICIVVLAQGKVKEPFVWMNNFLMFSAMLYKISASIIYLGENSKFFSSKLWPVVRDYFIWYSMSCNVGLQLLCDSFRSHTVFMIYFKEIRVEVNRHQVIFVLKLVKVWGSLRLRSSSKANIASCLDSFSNRFIVCTFLSTNPFDLG